MSSSVYNRPKPSQEVESQDPYADYLGDEYDYDAEWGEDSELEAGDIYLSDEISESEAQDANSLRQRLKSLENDTNVSAADRKELAKEINRAQALSGKDRDAELARIAQEISALEGNLDGLEDEFGEYGEAPISAKKLQEELNEYKKEIQKMTNLSPEERSNAEASIDRLLSQMNLEGEELDLAGIQSEFETIQEEYKQYNSESSGLRKLADLTGLEIEILKKKAEAAGVDLNDPKFDQDLIEFLMEVSPSLKDKFESAQEANKERYSWYEGVRRGAENVKQSFKDCTSDDDYLKPGFENFQYLFDLKYGQDAKSKAAVSAENVFIDELVEHVALLFPDKEVSRLEPKPGAGWRSTYHEFLASGQIKIGNQTYDMINGSTGELQLSQATDNGDHIKLVGGIPWDFEGTGNWHPEHAWRTYGQNPYDLLDLFDYDDILSSKEKEEAEALAKNWQPS